MLWATPPNLVRFCVGATFNTLPSLTNLVRWNLSNDASCKLCGSKVCTIPHILSGCDFARNNGRYTFRHDSVLLEFLKDTLWGPKFPCISCHKLFFKHGVRQTNPQQHTNNEYYKEAIDYQPSQPPFL